MNGVLSAAIFIFISQIKISLPCKVYHRICKILPMVSAWASSTDSTLSHTILHTTSWNKCCPGTFVRDGPVRI